LQECNISGEGYDKMEPLFTHLSHNNKVNVRTFAWEVQDLVDVLGEQTVRKVSEEISAMWPGAPFVTWDELVHELHFRKIKLQKVSQSSEPLTLQQKRRKLQEILHPSEYSSPSEDKFNRWRNSAPARMLDQRRRDYLANVEKQLRGPDPSVSDRVAGLESRGKRLQNSNYTPGFNSMMRSFGFTQD
jgi:hypothetical protein